MRRDSSRKRIYLDGSGPLFLVRGKSVEPAQLSAIYVCPVDTKGDLICTIDTSYTTAVA